MKKSRGAKGFIISVFWGLIVIGLLLAVFFMFNVNTPGDIVPWSRENTARIRACWDRGECTILSPFPNRDFRIGELEHSGWTLNLDGTPSGEARTNETTRGDFENPENFVSRDEPGYRGPDYGEPYVTQAGMITQEVALEMLESITIAELDESVEFNRNEWRHWTLFNSPCWSLRSETLYRQAVPGTVVLLDINRNVTENRLEACVIQSGEWICPYTLETITNPSLIEANHVVNLSIVAKSGGQNWTSEEKELFANDLINILSARQGSRPEQARPSEWMPTSTEHRWMVENTDYHCQFAKTYIFVIYTYGLTLPQADHSSLENTILNICGV